MTDASETQVEVNEKREQIAVSGIDAQQTDHHVRLGLGRRQLTVLPLAVLCLLWLWLVVQLGGITQGPRAVTFGGDFALNMSSSALLKSGGDPYDGSQLLRAEQAYMDRNRIPVKLGAKQVALTWGGYPPLFFWLLEPYTGFPFGAVAFVWICILTVAMIGGFVALLRYLGWHAVIPTTLLFASMPQTTLQAYYANPAGLVIGIILLVLFVQKRAPMTAGLVFSLAFLKPQLAVPALIVGTLFLIGNPRRFIAGLGIGLGGLLLASIAAVGLSTLENWVHGMFSVSAMVASQPNMVPLVGLYSSWTDSVTRTGIELAMASLAAGLTLFAWRQRDQRPVPFANVAWLWVLWFLVLPYAHFPDEILLAPAVLAFVGRDGAGLHRPAAVAVLYMMFFSVLLFSVRFHGAQLLSLPLVALLILLYIQRGSLAGHEGQYARPS